MTELFSIVGQLFKLGKSPGALRGRLAFAESRVEELGEYVDANPANTRKLRRKKRARTFWCGRVADLRGRLGLPDLAE